MENNFLLRHLECIHNSLNDYNYNILYYYMVSISYKNFDISKIDIHDDILKYDKSSSFILKTPIMKFKKEGDVINLFFNEESEQHHLFLEKLIFLQRKLDINKINLQVISETIMSIPIVSASKFFDSNIKDIDKNNLIGIKCIILLNFINNEISLKQLLILS